ncbi:hypothetical protein [Streptomyces noursei]|uniref:hypothetical protein n=1 Tax=Streptomyces noursei TaxID=1971 RepID=UPI00380F8F60
MTSTRRPLGAGTDRPTPELPERDPRTRTAAERAADGDWVEAPADPPAPVKASGRRPLGRRGA